ncbi:MAG: queuosine precursor transporter [Cyclobacteriaceae bacterium]
MAEIISEKTAQRRKNHLFIILAAIFIANAIVAEIIGVKIFSAEKTLGWAPAQIKLLEGFVLDFNLTAGVILWPVVFITTDVINEYFGKRGVKKITFIAVALIAYVFVVLLIVTNLAPADFWLDVNSTDPDGNPFDMNYAFSKTMIQGMGIIVASLIAFLVGQFLDVFIFQKLRKLTGAKVLWLRATGSTLVSQLIDSFVVLFIAFYLLGDWSVAQVTSVGIINYIYKFLAAVLLTPLIYLAHYVIDRYLGKNMANEMMDKASQDTAFI